MSILNLLVMMLAPVGYPDRLAHFEIEGREKNNILLPFQQELSSFMQMSVGVHSSQSRSSAILLRSHYAAHADARPSFLTSRPLRVVHSALCTRVLLNLRKAAAQFPGETLDGSSHQQTTLEFYHTSTQLSEDIELEEFSDD